MLKSKFVFRYIYTLILVNILLFVGFSANAQYYNGMQMEFGKNRVQYRDVIWNYFRYAKFDTYFYQNGRELASYVSLYADKYLTEYEDQMQTSLERKIQFIVFNNLSDLKSSNIGLEYDVNYNTGGVTHIIGTKVILYFDGNHENLEAQIKAGVTEVLMNYMISGGSIGSQIRSSLVIKYPEWYTKGLISFYSASWNVEKDNLLRDAILNKRFKKIHVLEKDEAILAGHSFWQFIAKQYGQENIPGIVQMSRVSRSIDNGFFYVLGKKYDDLHKEWLQYYEDIYNKLEGNASSIDLSGSIIKSKSDVIIQRPVLDPKGRYIAYVTNKYGKKKVWLYDLKTNKKKKLFRRGYILDDKNDLSFPLLAWHPKGNFLTMIVEEKGYSYFYIYDMEKKSFTKRMIVGFDKILDFSYSPNGTHIVMSAVVKGQSDIFTYELASGFTEQITMDLADDFHPRFINGGTEIVFSSNRTDVDLIKDEKRNQKILDNKEFDIFIYRYRDKSKILRQITDTDLENEMHPMQYVDGYLSYISDYSGVCNRFVSKFDSTISFVDTTTHYRYFSTNRVVSNYNRSVLHQDIITNSETLLELVYTDDRYYVIKRDISESDFFQGKDVSSENEISQLVYEAPEVRKMEDTIPKQPKQRVKQFKMVQRGEKDEMLETLSQEEYVRKYSGDGTDDKFKKPTGKSGKKAAIYQTQFGINQLINQVDFSNLNQTYQTYTGGSGPIYLNSDVSALFKVSASDLMENYRITGGVRLNFNLSDNEYLFSFENYKHRLDQEVVFHRAPTSRDVILYDRIVKLSSDLNEIYYNVSYPLDRVMSIRGSAYYRWDHQYVMMHSNFTATVPEINYHYFGLKASFVYDATRSLGLNLYEGTRFKIFGEVNQQATDLDDRMIVGGFDFRNYTKVYRTMIWANRMAYGTSFGPSHLIYYLGGVDSWLGGDIFNNDISVDQDVNYRYQTLATNMRGFKQNTRNGTNFAVINTELRIPVFRFLYNRPLRSDLLNNFQLIAFGDLGSSWVGVNPFSIENRTFETIVQEDPFYITLETIKSPLVGSIGTGVRTSILGYFVRFDMGWGIEDNHMGDMLYHLSFSLDF